MTTKRLKFFINWLWVYSQKQPTSGFTLIELLIGLLIAFLIIMALLAMVVDLLQVDSREAARNETQREMQIALDYIAADLREAVYVYDNNCLNAGQGTAPTATSLASVNYCPGLSNHLPSSLFSGDQTPVLAFWKPETIDDSDLDSLDCSGGTTELQQECQDLLVKRRTYTLVVYSQSTASSTTWNGRSRITRYALKKYSNISGLTESTGYVDPSEEDSTSFQFWPRRVSNGNNLQAARPTGNSQVLVDFVDNPSATVTVPACDTGYIRSPASSNSFFACVRTAVASTGSTGAQSGLNQDVSIYLRGNAYGKSGIRDDSFTPVLRTQVLVRGVINKIPE
ncbi:MAG TPA: hypothetical protein VK184_02930 [Nostocaceae cyanobacterium]|nr:hypothetical protein [Nostocaceae cyanobacterium]